MSKPTGAARLGKRQLRQQQLRQSVLALLEKHDDKAQGPAEAGGLRWGRIDKAAPWLPCVIVPPRLLLGRRRHLQLAKDVLSSKRPSAVVLWLGYAVLSKLPLQSTAPFADEPPEGLEALSARQRRFVEAALREAKALGALEPEQLVRRSREILLGGTLDDPVGDLFLASEGEEGEEEEEEEEEEGEEEGNEGGSRRLAPEGLGAGGGEEAAAGNVAAEEVLFYTGPDPFEPAWREALPPADVGGAESSPRGIAQAEGVATNGAGRGAGLGAGASGDADYDSRAESESEDEEYVPEGGGPKRKAPAARKGPASKKARPPPAPLSLLDRLKRWKKRIDYCARFPDQKEHVDRILIALQKMAKVSITADLLQRSEIGPTLQQLRKHPNERIVVNGKALRKIWRNKLVAG